MMLQYSRTNNQVHTSESEGTVILFDETIERARYVYRLSFCLRRSVKSIKKYTHSVIHVNEMP